MHRHTKAEAMEPQGSTLQTVPRIATNMGASILKALPTGSRIQAAIHAERPNDFDSFATSKPREFKPAGYTFQLSH